MENIWFIAAAWMGMALIASFISIRIGISVALAEILLRVLGGNFLHFQSTSWIDFLTSFGSVLLIFLAGAEIDPASFWKDLGPSFALQLFFNLKSVERGIAKKVYFRQRSG